MNSEGWPAVRSRTAYRLETVDRWKQHREFESRWFCVRRWTQRDFRMPMVSCWCRNPAVDSWLRSDAAELRRPAQVGAGANLREGLSGFRYRDDALGVGHGGDSPPDKHGDES